MTTIIKSTTVPPPGSPGDLWVVPYTTNVGAATPQRTLIKYVSIAVHMYDGILWKEIWNYKTGHTTIPVTFKLPYRICSSVSANTNPYQYDVLLDVDGQIYTWSGSSWAPMTSHVLTWSNPNTSTNGSAPVPLPVTAPSQSMRQTSAITSTNDYIFKLTSQALGPLVTIDNDGTMTYGPNYTPDAAAILLWDTIFDCHPSSLLKHIEVLEEKLANYEKPANATQPGDPLTDYDRAMKGI